MNRLKFLILFCLVASGSLKAQYVINTNDELLNLKKLPQEKVYLHHTGPIVFSGEYLYYSFYCINAQSNRASNVSFAGYVALVDQEGKYVLEQKVRLEKGKSQGDFFINTDVPSGNYKLLGYTQWMKNNGIEQVFQDDLVIINPYQANQSRLISNAPLKDEEIPKGRSQPIDSSIIQIKLDKVNFGTRENIRFTLKNYKSQLGYGNYTLRIQKKEDMHVVPAANAISFANKFFNTKGELSKSVGDSLFLPEQSGELLYGKVADKNGKPLPNTKVVVSVPGNEFLLKFATSDKNGNFYTYLRKNYKHSQAIMQLVNNEGDVDISLGKVSRLDASGLDFNRFYLKPGYADAIAERSVYNQLENQFFSAKSDSVLLGLPIDPFDGGMAETIFLDDYTRFNTFQETLEEVLNYAGYRNNPKGNDYIRITQDFETYNEKANDFGAIVLIDGVYISNHEKIKDFSARRIESISLVRDQFRMAGKDYQGMMSITTFEGDFYVDYKPENGINTTIDKALVKKNYFKQRYGEDTVDNRNIPDYRRLLLWEPHVQINGDEIQFECYTSDLTGEFEVVLDGFTTYGKPISVYKTIKVHNENQ